MQVKQVSEAQVRELQEYMNKLTDKFIAAEFDPKLYEQMKGANRVLDILNLSVVGVNVK